MANALDLVVCTIILLASHNLFSKIVFSVVVRSANQTVNDGVAHSKNPRKCAYHVTFDLDLDLENTLDAR